MIRVTINRDGLDKGATDRPILIEEADGQRRLWEASEVRLSSNARVIYRPEDPLPNGAVLWIEADNFMADKNECRQIP